LSRRNFRAGVSYKKEMFEEGYARFSVEKNGVPGKMGNGNFSDGQRTSPLVPFAPHPAPPPRRGEGKGEEMKGYSFGLLCLASSSFLLAPQHISIIWDILSAQLKEPGAFLAAIIFRIMSAKFIPLQNFSNSF